MSDTAQPTQPQPRGCINCGEVGTLKSVENEIKEKRRPKFGIFFILLSLAFGLGLILWLIAPRKNVVVSVDRYVECKKCKVRQ